MSIIPASRPTESPGEPRRTLLQHGVLKPTDHAGPIARLLDLWARVQAVDAHSGGDPDYERQLRSAIVGGRGAIIEI
jgi:hypothetical protein